jgi:predicted lipid-binding transport protein (Tim44 family)
MGASDVFMLALFVGVCVSLWRAFRPEEGVRGRMFGGGMKDMLRRMRIRSLKAGDAPVEPVEEKAARLARVDRSFEPQRFMEYVKKEFEAILEAFEKKDRAALRPRVSARVLAAFEKGMAEFEKRGRVLDTEIIRFKKIFIKDICVRGRVAEVTVSFSTEQTTVLRNAKGRVVKGDENRIESITDTWKFIKDTRSRRAAWILAETM